MTINSQEVRLQDLSQHDDLLYGCLTRTGNYRIHEFDWLKSTLIAVQIFLSRPAPRPVSFYVEKVLSELKYKNIHRFLLFSSQLFMEGPKSLMTKKSKKDEQLSSAPFASKMSANQLHLNELKFLLCHTINILLTELSRSVWENVDYGCVVAVRLSDYCLAFCFEFE